MDSRRASMHREGQKNPGMTSSTPPLSMELPPPSLILLGASRAQRAIIAEHRTNLKQPNFPRCEYRGPFKTSPNPRSIRHSRSVFFAVNFHTRSAKTGPLNDGPYPSPGFTPIVATPTTLPLLRTSAACSEETIYNGTQPARRGLIVCELRCSLLIVRIAEGPISPH